MATTGIVSGRTPERHAWQRWVAAAALAALLWGMGFVAGRVLAPDASTTRIAPAPVPAVQEDVGPQRRALPFHIPHHDSVKGG